MSWTPLARNFTALPLILAGPILRRVEPQTVTVWLALKEARTVTLRIYAKNDEGTVTQQFEGCRETVRVGEALHIVAVTASTANPDSLLEWGNLYYYDLFFQQHATRPEYQETMVHLETPGILNNDPSQADELQRLVYPGHPLPGFVLPPTEVNRLRIMHGSCRKAHGDGKEMLSTLDSLLEASARDVTLRPQQLYLTGDQIYADDVAAPLLFTLIDASGILFGDNDEEMLPTVNRPACTLPPEGRREVVRNQAMLTTMTPQNHLLSLGEYMAMYLFMWSNTLWPKELPDAEVLWQAYPEMRPRPANKEKVNAQYAQQIERLQAFRATLPQVRRALANIATYMICDDHEITDDWYLDGAWCRQVLASPLGRHILRNALLSYALFQAWGNTPEQFAAGNGTLLLNMVASWQGNEAASSEALIDELLGMPPAFDGDGELPRSKRALQWHYGYTGPRYQVIVMDTRTQRFYRSPDEFPGLLSAKAMHSQVTSLARKNAEATLIISATPVVGVDFIESIQFWSRWRVRDNYAYDREAWALEWGTFQRFLKTVSSLQRVVFLSGDVHYAFGSSLEYWDNHTKATAKLVNYTASSLCNEGSGSHMAVLAIGYPRLLHLFRRGHTPTLDFFAWDMGTNNSHFLDYILTLIRRRLYQIWWSLPRLIAARRSPEEIVLPARGWLKGAFDSFPPDRSYRVRYLRNTLYPTVPQAKRERARMTLSRWLLQPVRLALGSVTLLESIVGRSRNLIQRRSTKIEQGPKVLRHPSHALVHEAIQGTNVIERKLERRRNRLVETIFQYGKWLNRWKAGDLIVGYNNIGEISFSWTDERKEVVQRLWWWRPVENGGPASIQMTEYHDTLDLPTLEMEPPLP